MPKAEKFKIEDFSLQDIFKEDFLNRIGDVEGNIFPVSVVLINEYQGNGETNADPVIMNHKNKDEVDGRVIHIESQNTELLRKISEVLENTKQ